MLIVRALKRGRFVPLQHVLLFVASSTLAISRACDGQDFFLPANPRSRVNSWNELKARILQGIAEINQAPVVHRWKKFDLLAS